MYSFSETQWALAVEIASNGAFEKCGFYFPVHSLQTWKQFMLNFAVS